ncbi:2-succinyl-6-hydroxy-2,4-cyclohexadiene-1-carboxylate synthase [Bacillus sp. FJAT-52991]|uniref:Putative 2-succinyl-6-hydroxy-2,4-cyclohexadiene-1-carboxylate synthase n=1 Tax=Bacillus kandeliae TaxID=3129297 RepID=A0ABZ2N483_9BACI
MELTIHDCRYHYEVIGSGEPILLLHGFTGDHTTWADTTALLTDRYQCIMVDLLGHGKSSCPEDPKRYDIQLVARDLKELMHQLTFERFHILGYSMGGRLALTMAVLFPEIVQSVMLESTSPGLKTEEERAARRTADEKLAMKIETEGIKAFVDFWTNIPLFATQKKLSLAKQKVIRHQRLQNNVVGLSGSLKGMGTGSQPSWWKKLSALKIPVLLVTGTLDEKFTNIALEMNKQLPQVTWKEVSRKGHAIHVEDCEEFGTIIREFLVYT